MQHTHIPALKKNAYLMLYMFWNISGISINTDMYIT